MLSGFLITTQQGKTKTVVPKENKEYSKTSKSLFSDGRKLRSDVHVNYYEIQGYATSNVINTSVAIDKYKCSYLRVMVSILRHCYFRGTKLYFLSASLQWQ